MRIETYPDYLNELMSYPYLTPTDKDQVRLLLNVLNLYLKHPDLDTGIMLRAGATLTSAYVRMTRVLEPMTDYRDVFLRVLDEYARELIQEMNYRLRQIRPSLYVIDPVTLAKVEASSLDS